MWRQKLRRVPLNVWFYFVLTLVTKICMQGILDNQFIKKNSKIQIYPFFGRSYILKTFKLLLSASVENICMELQKTTFCLVNLRETASYTSALKMCQNMLVSCPNLTKELLHIFHNTGIYVKCVL